MPANQSLQIKCSLISVSRYWTRIPLLAHVIPPLTSVYSQSQVAPASHANSHMHKRKKVRETLCPGSDARVGPTVAGGWTSGHILHSKLPHGRLSSSEAVPDAGVAAGAR